MNTLLDILQDSDAGSGERLETSVVGAIRELANLIEANSQWKEGRLKDYMGGVEYFLRGLLEGSGRLEGSGSGGAHYDLGFQAGVYSKGMVDSALSEGQSKVADSYSGFISQLSTTAKMLLQRLRRLSDAAKSPYAFVIDELKNEEEDFRIAKSLAGILGAEKKLVASVVQETLEPNFVRGLEFAVDEGSHLQLGVIYLFRNEPENALPHFIEVKRTTRGGFLLYDVETIANDIFKARDVLMKPYSLVKSAMDFNKVPE